MKEGISVLMAFARAGIVAEEAGTLLWTTVRDLQRANIKFRSEWKKFGIDVYDKTTRNMRNMADIFSDLEDRFNTLSDEAKKASLQMLGFQDRSLRGIQALMGFSDEMKIFQKAMDNMGNLTERVADTYKKSFSAQMKMAKHNIEAMAISIGWILSPFLIKMNEQIKRLVIGWESLSNGAKLLIIEIAAMVAVAGPLLFIFGKIVMTVTYLSIAFNSWLRSIMALAMAFKTMGVVLAGFMVGIVGFIAAGYVVRAVWLEGIGTIKDNLVLFVDIFKLSVDALKAGWDAFCNFFKDKWEKTGGKIVTALGNFYKDLTGLVAGIKEGSKGPVFNYKDFWSGFASGWEEGDQAIANMQNRAKERYENLKVYLAASAEAFGENVNALGVATKTQLRKDMDGVINLISDKVKMMNEKFLKLLPEEDMLEIVIALDKISKEMSKIKVPPPPIERWDTFLTNVGNMAERSIDVAINAFNGLVDTIATNLEQGIADWKAYGAAVLQEINRMIIGMMLAEGYKKALSIFKLGGIEKEEAGMPMAIEAAGLSASASITTAGTTMATAITTAGYTAAAAISAAATGAAISSFFGGAAGTTGGGANATFNSTTIPKALGGAFDRGKEMMAFAKGGILNQPTLAPMALMGEAGPEAVMPLSRSASGELGVKATQPNINFNPQMKLIVVRDDREAALEAMRSPAGEKIIIQKAIRNKRTLG